MLWPWVSRDTEVKKTKQLSWRRTNSKLHKTITNILVLYQSIRTRLLIWEHLFLKGYCGFIENLNGKFASKAPDQIFFVSQVL